MKKYFFIIIIFLLSCAPTEPVEKHEDTSVLQDFINNSSGTLDMNLDIDSSGVIEPLELGIQQWENGRILELNCYKIGLSGAIPESIGELTELTQLGLKHNNLTGELPESIGGLTNLEQLNLADNTLSGTIPETMGNLKSLTYLVLSNNEFSGRIPNSLGELSILHTFLADSNNLSGTIPNDICNIYNEYTFDLSHNQFCPPLPDCLDGPNQIKFQNCDTSCGDGYDFLDGYCYSKTDLSVLDSLIINQDSLNMFFDVVDSNGVIEPLELGYQQWFAGRLEELDCNRGDTASCNLSITIPENIIELDSLKYLNLKKNSLSGKLPDGLGNLTALEHLNLQDNNLTGGFPEAIGDLPKLATLKLQNNKIGCYEFDFAEDTCRVHCNDDVIDVCSGYVSENICNIETIENVDLKNNMLCPCYPACITEEFSNFETLQDTKDCSYCNDGYTQICDDLPASVTILEGDSLCFNTANLAVLEAFIDSSLATLPNSLDVSMLTDSSGSIADIIPLELGEQIWENGKLISLDAKNRGLSGGIPQNIGNLDSLLLLYMSDNHLSGELPNGIYTLNNLHILHLAGNQLSGEINIIICTILDPDNWGTDGFNPNKSYLDNNKFCPGEGGYPDCIVPHAGVQDTTECDP